MRDFKLTRRALLRNTAVAGAAAGLVRGVPGLGAEAAATGVAMWPENGTLVPDEEWSLWVDERAAWKDDAIFLPEDVRLGELPVNAPTCGWERLEQGAAGEDLYGDLVGFWGLNGIWPTPEQARRRLRRLSGLSDGAA